MIGKWFKAAFLAILGIVLLLYGSKFVDELATELEEEFEVVFDLTWDLLKILIWILVAWLFVDAGLTIAISFTEQRLTLVDVMKRFDKIDKRLKVKAEPHAEELVEEAVEEPALELEAPVEEEEPPPPRE